MPRQAGSVSGWGAGRIDLAAADPGDGRGPDPGCRRRSAQSSSRRCPEPARSLEPDELARWHSLGLAVACADLVGVMRGAVGLAADYARERQAVRRGHRLVPGGPTPAGRRPGGHGGVAEHCPARRLGGRRPARGSTRSRPPRPPRHIAAVLPAPCARRPFRCTAESATPGSAWRTSICGVPSSRPNCSGGSASAWTGCWPAVGSEATMDFGDSPEEQAFRLRLRRVAALRTIRACRRRRRPTSTGTARRPGTRRSTTLASSACPGPPRWAGTACPASTTSSSTRSSPQRPPRRVRAWATWSRVCSSTGARTCSSASCRDW